MMRAGLLTFLLVSLPLAAAAQEAAAVPPITDEDRRAAFPDVHGHTVHDRAYATIRCCSISSSGSSSTACTACDGTAGHWFGGDRNRLWVKLRRRSARRHR